MKKSALCSVASAAVLLLAKGLGKFIWQQCGGVSVAERSIGCHCTGLDLLLG